MYASLLINNSSLAPPVCAMLHSHILATYAILPSSGGFGARDIDLTLILDALSSSLLIFSRFSQGFLFLLKLPTSEKPLHDVIAAVLSLFLLKRNEGQLFFFFRVTECLTILNPMVKLMFLKYFFSDLGLLSFVRRSLIPAKENRHCLNFKSLDLILSKKKKYHLIITHIHKPQLLSQSTQVLISNLFCCNYF